MCVCVCVYGLSSCQNSRVRHSVLVQLSHWERKPSDICSFSKNATSTNVPCFSSGCRLYLTFLQWLSPGSWRFRHSLLLFLIARNGRLTLVPWKCEQCHVPTFGTFRTETALELQLSRCVKKVEIQTSSSNPVFMHKKRGGMTYMMVFPCMVSERCVGNTWWLVDYGTFYPCIFIFQPTYRRFANKNRVFKYFWERTVKNVT